MYNNYVQVELKRIQQKNVVLTEEVEREGNEEDVDLNGDVSVERYSYIYGSSDLSIITCTSSFARFTRSATSPFIRLP